MAVGDRAALADAAAARLQAEAAQLPGLQLRTVTVPEAGHDGTRLFAALDRALADVPRSRLAGVVMLTDGEVHDIPAATPPVPLHVLLPAAAEQTDRRVRIVEAPSYGIVGKSVVLRVAVDDLGVDAKGTTAALTLRRDGEPPRTMSVPVGEVEPIEIPITRAGPTVVELTAAPLPGEVSDLNNHAVVSINGVRDRLRVLLVSGRAACRRAHLAPPAQGRPGGRPGALHHPAPAREGRPDAAERAGADRLPGARAVPGQDQGLRPDHPGPLRQPRHPARRPTCATSPTTCATAGRCCCRWGRSSAAPSSLAYSPLASVLPAEPLSGSAGVVEGPFRPRVTALGERHPVTAGLPGDHPGGGARLGRLVSPPAAGRLARPGGDGRPGRAPLLVLDRVGRAGRRCCCPTRSGCGRATTRAAARRPSCCAGSRTG